MSLLEIVGLKTYFHADTGTVRAVDDITLRVDEGKTLGIVGESGSGKSVTSFTVMKLLAASAKIESGTVSFLGKDLVGLAEHDMRQIRGRDISMIFQEPMTSLNPVFTVGAQVIEALQIHNANLSYKDARRRTIELFTEVGIPDPETRIDSYPHQLSGGQKQRVMIAMALCNNPKLLIADEPTTALDVTIQAQVLDILRRLRDQRGMSILFITHDLGVIAEIADDVAVMYRGKVVEYGPVLEIFQAPKHPYTKGLLACKPRLDTPYRLLPTVADFMDAKTDEQGNVTIIEKKVDDERWRQFKTGGRGRLLHPQKELAALGCAVPEASDSTAFVPEGTRPLLEVRNLKVYFPIRRGIFLRTVGHVKAVDDISFNVYKGQTLGLVGESGCGKTTAGRAILRLIEPNGGQVTFDGRYLQSLGSADMRAMRKRMQIIFQDPYGSLNPRMTVESTLLEPLVIHKLGNSYKDRRDRAVHLLEEVGLAAEHLLRYPHEFSGGQRQRICIARALAVEPEFIICDESVSALDVSVQAQVLNLLKELQQRRGLTYIFISHDLSVVKFMADMMAVMQPINGGGKIVEFGPSEAIYANPKEAYTRKLIEATPSDSVAQITKRQSAREAALRKRVSS